MPLAQSIGLDTLSKYFHLPINDVAKELGVCATVLKKICRKNGIPRWPHRKIKSLDKMIATLDASVAKNPEDEERIHQEIQTLKNKRTFLMKNPNVLASKPAKKGSKSQSKRAKQDGALNNDNGYSFEMTDGTSALMNGRGELNPMASALYSQLSHPHVPQPIVSSMEMFIPSPASPQWLVGDYEEHKSAFTSPKTLQQKYQFLQQQYDCMMDAANQYPPSPQVPAPPSISPTPDSHDPHAVPHVSNQQRLDFSIRLPRLRIPGEDNDGGDGDNEKPNKLSVMEPDMYPHSNSPKASPTSNSLPSSSEMISNRWHFPEWFEDEHKHIMKACRGSQQDRQQQQLRQPYIRNPRAPLYDLQVPSFV